MSNPSSITIKIDTVNAAFEGSGWSYEVARILEELSEQIACGDLPESKNDLNGNSVCKITYRGV